MTAPLVRPEAPDDVDAIDAVIAAAFRDMPYSDGSEVPIVHRLREQRALEISLVAVLGGRIVGHVAYSPAQAEDGAAGWYALGPVAVAPDLQRGGIGSALVDAGLDMLAERGAAGCIVVGDPGYYARFGFESAPEHAPDDQPIEYFMVKRIRDVRPAGRFRFHPAFYGAS